MRRRRIGALILGAVPLFPVSACDGEIRLPANAADGSTSGSAFDAAPSPTFDAGDEGAKIACKNDSACVLETLHCDLGSQTCVPCLSDAHCVDPTLKRCDTASHRCVECGIATDCASDRRCEPTTHKCVPQCVDGGTCPNDSPTCDVVRGLCVECTVSASCSSEKPICENGSGRCVECISDTNCQSPKPRCDRARGKCVECMSSAHCLSDRPLCDPQEGECK